MRIMPFMKRKKGVQFAGIGLDTGGGGGGGSYVLPTATPNRLGGIKVGAGLEVEEDGTLSTSGGGGGGVNYSTTEQVIGSWVDNSPVYSKTIIFDSSATSGGIQINTGIPSNLRYLEVKGCLLSSDGKISQIYITSDTYNVNGCKFNFPEPSTLFVNIATAGTIIITLTYVKGV